MADGNIEGLGEQLVQWRAAVAARVAAMQFETIEEFGRSLKLRGTEPLPPVPIDKLHQPRSYSWSDAYDQHVVFDVSRHHSQWLDWLHRGEREPVASMGIWHYIMYVYTVCQDPLSFDTRDFVTYRFADSHPHLQYRYRVQKLRVFESYRIPRLFGLTLSSPSADPPGNSLFQSMLFLPVHGAKDSAADAVCDYMHLVDDTGSFVKPWQHWFQVQRRLADNYDTLEKRAGKLFTIADVDVRARYLSDPGIDGRVQPSAAEFMAHITVEVSTNLDLAAEARSRPRGATRPDASDFRILDEIDVAGDRMVYGFDPEEEAPAGPGGEPEIQSAEFETLTEAFLSYTQDYVCISCREVSDILSEMAIGIERLSERTETIYQVPEVDMQTVGFHEEIDSVFMNGLGSVANPIAG